MLHNLSARGKYALACRCTAWLYYIELCRHNPCHCYGVVNVLRLLGMQVFWETAIVVPQVQLYRSVASRLSVSLLNIHLALTYFQVPLIPSLCQVHVEVSSIPLRFFRQ